MGEHRASDCLLRVGVAGMPGLIVGLIEVVDKVEDDTHAWLLIVGVPALLTRTVGVPGHVPARRSSWLRSYPPD